jgi:hypothetical protein
VDPKKKDIPKSNHMLGALPLLSKTSPHKCPSVFVLDKKIKTTCKGTFCQRKDIFLIIL